MKKSKLPVKGLHFYKFLLAIVFSCLLSVDSCAQKTTVKEGPFQPYGGRREITYNNDNQPVEFREYDAKGNLRRRITKK